MSSFFLIEPSVGRQHCNLELPCLPLKQPIEPLKEAIWLRGLVGDLGFQQKLTTMFCDNQSAIDLTNNPMYHERTKTLMSRHTSFGCNFPGRYCSEEDCYRRESNRYDD